MRVFAESICISVGIRDADVHSCRAAAPILGENPFSLPDAALQIQLSELCHILTAQKQTGSAGTVTERTNSGCMQRKAHRTEQLPLPESTDRLTRYTCKDAGQQIKIGVGIAEVRSRLVYRRMREHRNHPVLAKRLNIVRVRVEKAVFNARGL